MKRISKPWRSLTLIWLSIWFGMGLLSLRASGAHVLENALLGPSLLHPFGFDSFGRDLLTTVLRGSITSAAFGLAIVIFSTLIALAAGSAISVVPPRAKFASLRVLESLLAFPTLLFALSFAAIRGPGWDTLIFALLMGTLPGLIRLIQVRATEVLAEEYVVAAQSLGASPISVARNHLAPPLASLCWVKFPNLFSHALLAEATLSFLGIGAPIGRDTWGSLLAQGKDYLFESPHIALASGIPLVITVLSLQYLAESFRQRYTLTDPRGN